ncbi:MAG: hydroxymethylglutaryl-CoA reductase [Thermoanaerobaculia bacterium]|nr:MAG: hydroxymethylglutaryl-CoA reductase [Thermoanaerobaculia bacterium]
MLFKIPSLLLKQLYTFGSLENTPSGVRLALKNRLSDATVTGIGGVSIDGRPADLTRATLELPDGRQVAARSLSASNALDFPLRRTVVLTLEGHVALEKGHHEIELSFEAKPFGGLSFKVHDAIAEEAPRRDRIPYHKEDDHSHEWAGRRQAFAADYTGRSFEHVDKFSFDPSSTRGNIENFVGVAQVPIGLAGPLRVNGEHATGEFLIPLATTEGTLVASYSRGMKVINLSGGVTCTVLADAMQRAPVFVFDSARDAREFALWVEHNIAAIREHAESTSSVAKLLYIDSYLAAKFAYLRFNFATGDAAGQNMVGRATFAACSWVLEQEWPKEHVRKFYLESNLATDKKASQVNVMKTRGKRVVAECTIPREVLIQNMRVEPEQLHYHAQVANVGAFISGANNNGAHSPNGITAMFIATGQDVANVSESSAGIVYTEITPERDLYISITIPSLIVATHGGGTGLPTQRECLELLGCRGRGSVRKLAEIIAGVVLAGEVSLGAAISSLDWVSSHEKYGRNR